MTLKIYTHVVHNTPAELIGTVEIAFSGARSRATPGNDEPSKK